MDLYAKFIQLLIAANDETKTEYEHEVLVAKLNGWKDGVQDVTGHWFNGDNYYLGKFEKGEINERPLCCGEFIDWQSKVDNK